MSLLRGRFSGRRVLALSLVLLVAMLSGCRGGAGVTYYETVAYESPPEPLVEVIPYSPGPDAVWLPGYWYWTGARYVWVPGRYAVPPSAGYVWIRSGWVRSGASFTFVRGYWAPSSHRPHHVYVHHYPAPHHGSAYRSYPRRGPGRR